LPRRKLAGAFGGLDHAEGQTILDRPQWVEGLDLDEEVDALRRQPVDSDDRSAAYRLEDVLSTR
jgi:hypothetical protein